MVTIKFPRVSEHEEQANFFSEIGFRYSSHADFEKRLLFSVPNGMLAGGKNKFALMAKFKAEGMSAGVADVLYLQPRGEYSCLAIEMKAKDRRNVADAVSKEQAEFIAAINGSGGIGEVCYGCEEALQVFDAYMKMEAV